MDSTNNFFDAIYGKLVLRDFVGKVVPGSVLILSMGVGLYDSEDLNHLLAQLHWALLIVGGGAAWLAGFALQYTGERARMLRTHPHGEKGSRSSRSAFFTSWAEFHSVATDHQKIHAERLNVIKESCGNGAVALLIGAIAVFVGQLLRGVFKLVPTGMLLFIAILAGLALWRMHIEHVERYGHFVRDVLGLQQLKAGGGDPVATDAIVGSVLLLNNQPSAACPQSPPAAAPWRLSP